jgi:hypothetical protein
MQVTFDPQALVDRILRKYPTLLNKDLSFKAALKKAILATNVLTKKDLNETIRNALRFYKKKVSELERQESGLSKQVAAAVVRENQSLIKMRVENAMIQNASEIVKENFEGQKYMWLPSTSENPDEQHMLNYGKIFVVGEGEQPGDRWGCRCGMRIMTNVTDARKVGKLVAK